MNSVHEQINGPRPLERRTNVLRSCEEGSDKFVLRIPPKEDTAGTQMREALARERGESHLSRDVRPEGDAVFATPCRGCNGPTEPP